MKRAMAVCAVMLVLGLSGMACSAWRGAAKSWGFSHKISMYSGGKLVREWKSVGKVSNEGNSDGYYFMDQATNQLVVVSGDVAIEVIK